MYTRDNRTEPKKTEMSEMRIRAAGISLTVGELREAIDGLADTDQVFAHDRLLSIVETNSTGVELDPDVAALDTDDLEMIMTSVRQIRELARNGQVREIADNLIEEFG